ncbi:MAG: RNA-binding transcriptional accessory protein, partial [Spirochaeta sp.]|nr:RNA-binding transcriptional accessory protein [Spirochaeta sp.]
MNQIDHLIANECAASASQVAAVRALYAEGGTVPFIARYRKERTGNLDETVLRAILAAEHRLTQLEERRQAILANLGKRALLTPELESAIGAAPTRTELEDIYLPYKQRTKTRADRAREAGLQPLADALLTDTGAAPQELVKRLCPPELSVTQAEAGARDILAETLSVDPELRARLRQLFVEQGALASSRARKRGTQSARHRSTGAETPKPRHGAETYRDYEAWREPARRAPSHRVLAILRGAEEGHLSVSLKPPEPAALRIVTEHLYRRTSARNGREAIFRTAALDAWKRLLAPSLEREALAAVRTRAATEARGVFQKNLTALLLAPPYGARPVLALDPGLRTGCKLACLGAAGEVLEVGVIYPLPPHSRRSESADLLSRLCRKHAAAVIAVGDGTGGRETEQFVREVGVTDGEGTPLPVI